MKASDSLKIAVIDDCQDDLHIFQMIFQRWNSEHMVGIDLSCFADPRAFFKDSRSFDLVITDLKMGDISGRDVFKWLIKRGVRMPVILMKSGAITEKCDFEVALSARDISVEKILNKYAALKNDRMKNAFQFNFCAANYAPAFA